MDQNDPEIATIAMETRIAMRLDVCVKNGCTSTDMAMVALLAGDERITPTTLKQAFQNIDYKIKSGTVTLDWENFLLDNWKKPDNRRKNRDLMKLFSKNVQEKKSQDFPEIDWNYIDGLAQ
jgi:hypothetical protein